MKKDKKKDKADKYGKPVHVAFGERLSTFRIENNKAVIEFDWLGLGAPRSFQLKVGDQIEDVALPVGFPKTTIDYTDIVKAYDVEQKCSIRSTPNRVPNLVEIEIDLAEIELPTYLYFNGEILVCMSKVGNVTTVRDKDGKWLYDIVASELNDFQKAVLRNDPCRPTCIWASIKINENQYPWEQESIRLIPGYIVYTFRRRVIDVWNNFHCEGTWKYDSSVYDERIEREVRRVKTE